MAKSLYNKDVHDNRVRDLAIAGLTQDEIANEIGVTKTTLQNWIYKSPSLRLAWTDGRNQAIIPLEESLWSLTQSRVLKTVRKDGQGNIIEIIEIEKEPSVHALRVILAAKNPQKYQNRLERGEISTSSTPIINILKEDSEL